MLNRSNFLYAAIFASAAFCCGGELHAQNPFFHADSGAARRVNLGRNVNSVNIELLPLVSPDGKTLYFDRKYSINNVGGKDDEDDIYYSTLQPDGKWSAAQNIGAPLNTPGSDVLFWISPDGNSALVHNGGDEGGHVSGLAISRKEKDGGWGVPTLISIDGLTDINALGDGYSATISPDGSRLILALSRDTSDAENLDLFSCPVLSSDYLHWGAPVTLGTVVNTPRYEWAPYMASDNKTLYFASGGQLGFGNSDIFMTRRLDDTWEHWSDPFNLGSTINTAEYETAIALSPKGDYAYISASGLNGEENLGKTDIYRVLLPEAMRPLPVVAITGKLNAGGKAVKGLVRVEKTAGGEEVGSMLSDDNGGFHFLLPAGAEYKITGWADGYDESTAKADFRKKDAAPAVINLSLRKAGEVVRQQVASPQPHGGKETTGNSQLAGSAKKRGGATDVASVKGITIDDFAVGSAEIPKSAIARLTGFVTDLHTLWAGQVLGIEVVGYCDSSGVEIGNEALSLQRAEAVKQWMGNNGVDITTIITLGRGNASPIVRTGNAAARARNRRVEIRIVATMSVVNPK